MEDIILDNDFISTTNLKCRSREFPKYLLNSQETRFLSKICQKVLSVNQKNIPTFPVSTYWNFFKGRIWTLGKILPHPVNQELFGGFSSPASSSIVKISYIMRFFLFL